MSKSVYRGCVLRYILVLAALMLTAVCIAGCGDDGIEDNTETVVQSGSVDSPEAFTSLGMYIDVDTDNENVTDVSYSISGEIARVAFRYTGVRVEYRASCKYEGYELAGVEDTSKGDMIVAGVGGLNATFYTLDPGRVAFWSDGTVNYSLYIYVTASNDVLNSILELVRFENRYKERSDVQEQTYNDAKEFAKELVTVFNDKNLEALADMTYYPQETGNGQSIAKADELLAIDKGEFFTDILLEALNEEGAVDELRTSKDEMEYIIGSNYKNVHFKLMDDGSFKITKINN